MPAVGWPVAEYAVLDVMQIDFVSPKEAMDISGLLMRVINDYSPDLSKSSDESP